MKTGLKDLVIPLFITILILIVLEIMTSTLFPAMGIQKYSIPFNILIVLFLGFKLETPALAIMICIVQYFHSFFSIEGWEVGTIAGVTICIVISYLRDVIHFSSSITTVFVTQIFQCLWFVVTSSILYLKVSEFSLVIDKFWRFLPESIVISILAPFFFGIFDRIWGIDNSGMLGDKS